MLYLIEYDRANGGLSMASFRDEDRKEAEDARLDLELELNRAGVQKEIVLLQAGSEEALRITHRRYFESLSQLTRSSATTASSWGS